MCSGTLAQAEALCAALHHCFDVCRGVLGGSAAGEGEFTIEFTSSSAVFEPAQRRTACSGLGQAVEGRRHRSHSLLTDVLDLINNVVSDLLEAERLRLWHWRR